MSREMVKRGVLAKKLGVSRQRIAQLIKSGQIDGEGEDGLIDLDRALGQYQRNTDAAKRHQRTDLKVVASNAAPKGGGEGQGVLQLTDLNKSKAAQAYWSARRIEQAVQQEAGQLLSRDQVVAKEFNVARLVRDRLLGFPAKCAGFMPPEALRVLEVEIEALIRELQDAAASIAVDA
jgi:hypothetical protein